MSIDPQQLPTDRDLDWWVNDASGDLGLSGTHGAVMGQLERGGPASGYVGKVDEGCTPQRKKAVERYARIEPVWNALDADTRRTLRCYYEHRQFPPGVRAELGQLAGVVMISADKERATQAAGYLHPDPTKYDVVDGVLVKPKQTNDLIGRAKAVLSHVAKAASASVEAAHAAVVAARLAEKEDQAERAEANAYA